ncbi:ATP-binding protein [Clostridium sp. YIM B02555]|uniref:ATP-binding protein n=1 Tax=Clostridium sp. YIM B02555 TaxID=2911968 RepID=UPI001EEF5A84|nr:ATP-binding protein [Clostridium sp. YIM B02555]
MQNTKGEVVFYGVDDINSKLENILKDLDLKEQSFETKLILSEAINNAFIHGNKGNKEKSIYVQWNLSKEILTLTVTDCGEGIVGEDIFREVDEDNLLEESGRGLYIIRSYTDEVIIEGNSIIMKKTFNRIKRDNKV